MARPRFLCCLLLLPLGACFPLRDREAPMDTPGDPGGQRSWARFPRGPPPWPSAPRPPALLVVAQQLLLRFGRQDEGRGAAGLLLAEGDRARSPLGTLAEELSGYSRKKGGFHFRFGRR